MIKFLQKHKLHFLATLLSVFMCMSFGVFSVYAPKVAFAEDEVEYYPTPVELIEYCTNYGYDEHQADNFAEEIEEVYSDYVDYDGEHLTFYSEDAPEVFDNHEEVIAMISANIDAMNELVDEGVGYIDENWEFQPEISETYALRANQWKFKLKWNKATATFSGDAAIVSSLILLTCSTIFSILDFDLDDFFDMFTEEGFVEYLMNSAFEDCKEDLISELDHLTNSSVISELSAIVDLFFEVINATSVYGKIIKIIATLLLPSIEDCLIAVHCTKYFDAQTKLIACWIPLRKDHLGVSLEVIE